MILSPPSSLPLVVGARATEYRPGQCDCICFHDSCELYSASLWCRHWCSIRWVVLEYLDRDAVEGILLWCLAGSRIRYWGSSKQTEDGLWDYHFLLHTDLSGEGFSGLTFRDLLDPSVTRLAGATFDVDQCGVWSFRCCAESLRQDVNGHVLAIMSEDREEFGDLELVSHLREDVVAAGVYSKERED